VFDPLVVCGQQSLAVFLRRRVFLSLCRAISMLSLSSGLAASCKFFVSVGWDIDHDDPWAYLHFVVEDRQDKPLPKGGRRRPRAGLISGRGLAILSPNPKFAPLTLGVW